MFTHCVERCTIFGGSFNCKILWIYDNKKKTNDWLKRTRLQLPVGISRYGLINKISQTPININSQSSGSTHSFRKPNSPRRILADALDSAAQTDEEKRLLKVERCTIFGGSFNKAVYKKLYISGSKIKLYDNKSFVTMEKDIKEKNKGA